MSKRFRNPKMWDFIVSNGKNQYEKSGFYNSFTGDAFSDIEMKELSDNLFEKIKPYLAPEKTALEIGCASGLTMFRLYPLLKHYIGTDMSKNAINYDQKYVNDNNIKNITLINCAADEIDQHIDFKPDIAILNSVCQYFPDTDYLISVIKKLTKILTDNGIIYFGDIMDLSKKETLRKKLIDHQKNNPSFKLMVNIDEELFLPKSFFTDLPNVISDIKSVDISDKAGTIDNELKLYRYDIIAKLGEK